MAGEVNPVAVKEKLAEGLIAVGAVEFGTFTLASGQRSDVYVNIKRAITRPDLLALCAKAMSVHARGADRIAGVELGAVPLAVATSLETGLPYVMVRKQPKGHGTRGWFEGDLERGDRVVMVEDVTTTAGSCVKGLNALREAGARIDTVVVVVDRCEGAAEALEAAGATLIPILTLDELRAQR
jgi:orotate phosphoribosyltransferase